MHVIEHLYGDDKALLRELPIRLGVIYRQTYRQTDRQLYIIHHATQGPQKVQITG